MLRSASRAGESQRTRRCRCQAARSPCLDPHREPTRACTTRRQPQVQHHRAAGRRSRARRHSPPRAIQPRWVPWESRSSSEGYASQRAGCRAQRCGEHLPTTWVSFLRWRLPQWTPHRVATWFGPFQRRHHRWASIPEAGRPVPHAGNARAADRAGSGDGGLAGAKDDKREGRRGKRRGRGLHRPSSQWPRQSPVPRVRNTAKGDWTTTRRSLPGWQSQLRTAAGVEIVTAPHHRGHAVDADLLDGRIVRLGGSGSGGSAPRA